MKEIQFNRLLKRYKYDRVAVIKLYEYYYPLIVRNINRQFRGYPEGKDVAQQFFLKLFDLKAYHIRAPNAWVYKVTKNIALQMINKNQRQVIAERRAAVSEESYLSENISDALDCLNAKEKKIIYLCYWERYRLKEISELLDMEYYSVKYFHKSAKKKLKKVYRTYEKIY